MSNSPESTNKAAFRRVLDATNTHDVDLIFKTIDEVFDPDVRLRTPLPLKTSGADAIKEVFGTLHRVFPDIQITVEDLIAEDNKVVCRNTVTGTQQGEYMGRPPTGKSVTYNEVIILRFAGGRIAETWAVVDVLSQMKQLGFLPA